MSNWKHLVGGVAMTALTAAYVQVAEAQVTTSSVQGRVTNESGAPISGASVTIRNTDTGFTRTTETSGSGFFSVRSLPVAGSYTVETSVDGYRISRIEDIGLVLGDATNLDFSLESSDETMTMDAIIISARSIPSIQVAVGPSSTFSSEDLQNAPTVNRNFVDVLRIDPLISVDESRGDINPINCGGRNSRFNSFTLDGVRTNDGFGLNSNGYPTERQPYPYDAIETVAVEMAPFDVEYGGFTACAINAVTKSGTNEFHGSVFFDYTSNDLRGDSLEGEKLNRDDYDETQYGLHLSGPIVKDKLFFAVSYEKLDGAEVFTRGVEGSGALNEVPITQAELDEITQIARDLYNYDTGTLPSSADEEDEKLLIKFDWNISDNHRAAFTYNYNDGFNITPSDGDLDDEIEFEPHYYERGAELNSYSGFLFSDWTDRFSTELRLGYVDLQNRQLTLGGNDFGEIRVETGDVDVYLGGDDSRQSNELDYQILSLGAKGFYNVGDHDVTFGYEREQLEIYNLFVQHTETEIRFRGGIDAFRAGTPSAIYYNNSPNNIPAEAAADWGYAIDTLYAQDKWQITDKVQIIAGLRYDYWSTDDKPAENADFVADYGFSNSQTLDGADLIQPRIAVNFEPTESLSLRAGIGIFSGGDPNVWLSNTYSANNVNQFGVRGRNFGYTDGSRTLFDDDIVWKGCEEGVPEGAGWCIPGELFDAVTAGEGANFEINYLDPDFEIPSEVKFNVGGTWAADFGGPSWIGGEYLIEGDIIVAKGQNSPMWRHADLERIGTTEGDFPGYPVYDSVREPAFVLTNSDEGNEAFSAAFTVAKDYGNGFDWQFGYAYSDAQDVQPMTSSVAFSNYVFRAFTDPEEDVLSTTDYNTKHRMTFFANYEKAFFGDYLSRVSIFGLAKSGSPYSITYDGGTGTATIYGFTPWLDFQNNVLPIGNERNGEESDWWGKIDLSFSQELPGIMSGHRTRLYVDIDNFTNMLNDEWGILREHSQRETIGSVSPSRIGDASSWEARIGIAYEF